MHAGTALTAPQILPPVQSASVVHEKVVPARLGAPQPAAASAASDAPHAVTDLVAMPQNLPCSTIRPPSPIGATPMATCPGVLVSAFEPATNRIADVATRAPPTPMAIT